MEQQNKLQLVVAEQSQQLIAETKQVIKELHKSIVIDRPLAVIPESVFVEYFLDFFRYPNNYPDTLLLSKWNELAGGPYNEVNVIDPTGVVLYTTPGVFPVPNIEYAELSKYNFSDVASNYVMRKKITSTHATNYIHTVLSTVSASVHPAVEEHIMRWVNIFNRYPTGEQVTVKPVVKPNAPDLGIFDM